MGEKIPLVLQGCPREHEQRAVKLLGEDFEIHLPQPLMAMVARLGGIDVLVTDLILAAEGRESKPEYIIGRIPEMRIAVPHLVIVVWTDCGEPYLQQAKLAGANLAYQRGVNDEHMAAEILRERKREIAIEFDCNEGG